MKTTLAFLLILALLVLPACTQPTDSTPPPDTTSEAEIETTSPTEPPTTTQEQEETEEPTVTITEEDVEAARQVVFAYWEAFNSYDVDGVLAFMEESWREQRTDDIASEISQMKGAGVTMVVEEEAEPEVTTEGAIAIKMFIDIPIMIMPDRHYIYYLKDIDGEWKIYFAEEVEE